MRAEHEPRVSARLKAEARLVRESKRRTNSHSSLQNHHLGTCTHFPSSNAPSSSSSAPALHKHDHALLPSSSSYSLDHAMRGWNNDGTNVAITRISGGAGDIDLESPTSTLSFSENNIAPPIMTGVIEFVGSSERGLVKEEGGQEWNKGYDQNPTHDLENSMPFTSTLHAMTIDATWGSADHDQSLRPSTSTSSAHTHVIEQGFTNLLLNASSDHRSLSPDNGGESNNHHGSGDDGSNDQKKSKAIDFLHNMAIYILKRAYTSWKGEDPLLLELQQWWPELQSSPEKVTGEDKARAGGREDFKKMTAYIQAMTLLDFEGFLAPSHMPEGQTDEQD
ncbi:hypothetical protein RJT34_13089 [Clitoria ternatea]|uniref:Uncharacterized protein n=1 Tax=Clitoria ternatea TaxID=43366 RepID=A0AAN9JQ97_CLITE